MSLWHICDVISHSRLSRLAKLLQFIPQSKLLSMIFLADEHLCLISIMSVCFGTNNVSLFLSLRFLVFREDSWLWRRAEGRGWCLSKNPGCSQTRSVVFFWLSPALICLLFACLFLCVYVGMSLPVCSACLNALQDWFPSLVFDDLSVRTHRSQIRSTRGRVALNSDADAKAEVSRGRFYCSEEAKRGRVKRSQLLPLLDKNWKL